MRKQSRHLGNCFPPNGKAAAGLRSATASQKGGRDTQPGASVAVCSEEKVSSHCQLAATPMGILARWIEDALNMTVQCSHHADPRKHRLTAERHYQDQAPQRSDLRSPSCAALGIDEIAAQTQGSGDRSISGGFRQCRAMSPIEARAENIGPLGAFPGLTQLGLSKHSDNLRRSIFYLHRCLV